MDGKKERDLKLIIVVKNRVIFYLKKGEIKFLNQYFREWKPKTTDIKYNDNIKLYAGKVAGAC